MIDLSNPRTDVTKLLNEFNEWMDEAFTDHKSFFEPYDVGDWLADDPKSMDDFETVDRLSNQLIFIWCKIGYVRKCKRGDKYRFLGEKVLND